MKKRKPEKPEDCLGFYLDLLVHVYRDAAASCDLRSSSLERDVDTLSVRTKAEGMHFLTKELPSLGKCLDKVLSSECLFPDGGSFERSKKSPYLPKLFGGFWKLIFNQSGGIMEAEPADSCLQIQAVRAVRQVCYLFYKLECAYDHVSEQLVLDKFVLTDDSLPMEEEEVSLSRSTSRALESARMLIWYVLKDFDPWDITPGHGPGAVSTGEKQWNKMQFRRFYVELDREYSYPDYFFLNYSHLCETLETLENMTVCHEGVAKVTLVPKDSRGPRVISMEPLELQWIQQGLCKKLVRTIEHPSTCSSGYVNFTYQDINRDLALEHSYDGELITIDMEEASDRVSLWLVKKLFPPHVYRCLKACRSGSTELPDGRRISLKKFAPMGSSTCFPVEALIFWALAVGSLRDVYSAHHVSDLPPVYVYGDDIILRKEDYDRVRTTYEDAFLRVNVDKCCTGRFFRESCGMDAFKCHAVNPVRVKAQYRSRMSPTALLSYVSYVNNFQGRGYTRTVDFLRSSVVTNVGQVPVIRNAQALQLAYVDQTMDESEVKSNLLATFKSRFNSALQREEVRLLCPHPVQFTYGEPDWAELHRVMLRAGLPDPFGVFSRGKSGPCRYVVPHQIKMRWRWVDLNGLLSL